MTVDEFKASFPEFKNEGIPKVERHITAAAPMFDVGRWGAQLPIGLGNYVAHTITLENRRVKEAAVGGGARSGDETGKRVGGVAVQRDGNAIRDMLKNPFLSSPYGTVYYQMAKRIGQGAVTP